MAEKNKQRSTKQYKTVHRKLKMEQHAPH